MSENRTHPLRLAIIIGSTREGRFGPAAAHWFAGQARRHDDMEADVIDLADLKLPSVMTNEDQPEVKTLGSRLSAAEAFVIVTPEYNHSFPASLKNAIDYFNKEWHAKPIGFVSYGGTAGGQRAVEHLRQVFAELHAVTVRDTIAFVRFWEQFGRDGQPEDPEGANVAAKKLLDQLSWWGNALRTARTRHPYAA